MKAEERRQLKENEARNIVIRTLTKIGPHFSKILFVAIILMIAFITFTVWNYTKKKGNETAGKEIQKSLTTLAVTDFNAIPADKLPELEKIVEKYKNTKNGAILAFQVGNFYYSEGQYDKAIELYNTAKVTIDNKDAVRIALSTAYVDKKDYKAAVSELKNIKKTSIFADNALYLNYICAKAENDTAKLTLYKIEIEKETYKKTPYYQLIKTKESL